MMGEAADVGQAALRLFDAGWYCAESVLLAVAAARGHDAQPLARLATPLCSGGARTGGMCGALAGGLLAMGLIHGRTGPTDSVERCYALSQELIGRFRERFGAVACTELLGCDLGADEGRKAFKERGLMAHCREFTAQAACMAADILKDG